MGRGSSRTSPRRSLALRTALLLALLYCVRAPPVAVEQSNELNSKRTCGCAFEDRSAGEVAVDILIHPARYRAGEHGAVEHERQALSVLFAALDLEDLQGCTLSFWIDCERVLQDGHAWNQVFPCAMTHTNRWLQNPCHDAAIARCKTA